MAAPYTQFTRTVRITDCGTGAGCGGVVHAGLRQVTVTVSYQPLTGQGQAAAGTTKSAIVTLVVAQTMSALERTVRDQRGFTLAELMVVMALTGLVLAGVFAIQQEGTNSYLMGAGRVETQQNARVALEQMVRELRSAESITALGSATDITFVDVRPARRCATS